MLETQHVFLDTEAIVRARFVFDGGSLKRVAELCASGKLNLVVPEITRREVEKKIDEHVDEVAAKVTKALKQAPAVKALVGEGTPFIAPRDPTQIKGELKARFRAFLAEAGAQDVPFDEAHGRQLLDNYFGQHPPFGPGDKKYQFLDGLALTALKEWADAEEVRLYVVSRDGDIKTVADTSETLLYLESVQELFDLVEIADARAVELVRSVEDQIKRQIAGHVPAYGFMLDHEDGDVGDVGVRRVEIEDLKVQDVQDDVVRFVADALVSVRADVSYWRSDNATYDSETGTLFYHDRAEHSVNDELRFQVLGSVVAKGPALTNPGEPIIEFDTTEDFLIDPHGDDW